MSTTANNLLNLNVDLLFEQHSTPEIDIVHKKIQGLVEEKREELRTMVGERYRDLLKAADTIAAMQQSSNTLIEQVNSISTSCRSLNEQQLLGFKVGVGATSKTNKELNNYFSTMVQIKLLTSLPELIWAQLDQERFYIATELFIFSRHISTGLQLDAHNTLLQRLPIAKKQWEILKPFRITIKQRVTNVLEREEVSANVAIECVLSLLLLEKCDLNSVLKIFLKLRCAAFFNSLGTAKVVSTEHRRIKGRILASFKVANSTIELLQKCFLENGVLFEQLASYADVNAPATIAHMDSCDVQFASLLPDIISNFRPQFELKALDDVEMRTALEEWLADISRIAAVQLRSLFDMIPTLKMIQELKIEANEYRKHLDFTAIVDKLQLAQSLDFYELKYLPLINQRVHNIISDSWAQAMGATFTSLESILQHMEAPKKNIWTEKATDLPLSLEEALNEDHKKKQLFMKSKGYDSALIALCTDFDQKLASIVSAMQFLVEEQHTKVEYKLELIEFLRDTAQTQLLDFVSKIKGLNVHLAPRYKALYVVRLLIALLELCPHLKICLCQQSNWRWRQCLGNTTSSNIDIWQRCCLLLEEETLNIWQHIVKDIVAANHCSQFLKSQNITLEDLATWEVVTLEQKDEQDNAVQSIFRIPSQPRISLQSYYCALIRALNNEVPETLPPKVLVMFNKICLQDLLAHYQTLANQINAMPNQSLALQLYFDLKFVQANFAMRDERALNEQFHALQTNFKDNIDPFDFELFADHIATNVKRAVGRLHCQMGVLTPQMAMQGSNATTAIVQEKDPNVLSLSSSGTVSIWFPLLPIITPSMSDAAAAAESKKVTLSAVEKEKLQQTTPTRKSATTRKSDIPKSKSFFGTVSQDWFR